MLGLKLIHVSKRTQDITNKLVSGCSDVYLFSISVPVDYINCWTHQIYQFDFEKMFATSDFVLIISYSLNGEVNW